MAGTSPHTSTDAVLMPWPKPLAGACPPLALFLGGEMLFRISRASRSRHPAREPVPEAVPVRTPRRAAGSARRGRPGHLGSGCSGHMVTARSPRRPGSCGPARWAAGPAGPARPGPRTKPGAPGAPGTGRAPRSGAGAAGPAGRPGTAPNPQAPATSVHRAARAPRGAPQTIEPAPRAWFPASCTAPPPHAPSPA